MAEEDVAVAGPSAITLEGMFIAFAIYGPLGTPNGEKILLSQCDMWMKQSKLFNKNFTLTDTGMVFSKFKKRAIDYAEFEQYLSNLCEEKNLNIDEVKQKMTDCGLPGTQKLD